MQNPKNKGFSLIELMIVIAILGILVAVLMPQLTGMSEDAMISQARQSLVAMRDAATRYNAENPNRPLSNLDWLVPKYMKEMQVDPWNCEYTVRPASGVIFSPGPDRDYTTAYDNIEEWYLPKLMLESAHFTDIDNDNIINQPDTIRIRFTKPATEAINGNSPSDYTNYLWFVDDIRLSPTQLASSPFTESWKKGGDIPTYLIELGKQVQFDMAVILTIGNVPKTGSAAKTATFYVNTHQDHVFKTVDDFLSVQNMVPVIISGTDKIKSSDNV